MMLTMNIETSIESIPYLQFMEEQQGKVNVNGTAATEPEEPRQNENRE